MATEACRRLLRFAFEDTPLSEIVAVTEEGNLASERVLLKCGFEREGMRRAYGGQSRAFRLTRGAFTARAGPETGRITMKTEAIIEHITDWLRDYGRRAGAGGFVIGVSGGIDSAVSSTLSARTGLPLLVVEMPIHQGRDQVARARDHIAFLKARFGSVDSLEVELTEVFDRLVAALPDSPEDGRREMSLVNTRARLRMTTLYYFAALPGPPGGRHRKQGGGLRDRLLHQVRRRRRRPQPPSPI